MKFIYSILLVFITLKVWTQNAPNIWYFGDYSGLEFTHEGPKNILNSGMKAFEGSAVQVDRKGRLLFYTNGEVIYNRNHVAMENGEDLAGHVSAQQSSIIIPDPRDQNKYYVFTTHELGSPIGINYSIVDIRLNNGSGKVIEKNVNLQKPSTEAMSVIGSCACSNPDQYWLLSFKSNQKDSIYAYKIDRNGINKTPIRSYYKGIGQVDYLKISPKGDLVAFLDRKTQLQTNVNLVVARFDFQTGKIGDPINSEVLNGNYQYSSLFFSPDGKILYTNINYNISQYNVSDYYNNLPKTTLDIPSPPRFGLGQIGPDGKIYIALRDENFLAVINHPNEWGIKADLKVRGYQLNNESSWGLPHFPEQLGYNGVKADAGKDTIICSGENMLLAEKANPIGDQFNWSPAVHLNDPTLANPIFNYVNTSDKIEVLEYVLAVTNDYCSRCDTVSVSVIPKPDTTIYGPGSACPGVKGVEYSVTAKEGFSYQWRIEGGAIMGSDDLNSVKVNWGETNNNAKIKLFYSSPCMKDSIVFPVRINVELKTDFPEGEKMVCKNLLNNHSYSIPNSPGSTYTWGIEGGEIISGNSTHSILVNFNNTTQAKIWLEENSTTKDTVCYGVSDTLRVHFFQDTTSVEIEVASVDLLDETMVNMAWKGKEIGDVMVRSNSPDFTITPFNSLGKEKISVAELNTIASQNEFKITSINNCEEYIESGIHKVIWLKAGIGSDSLIHLEWTSYEGWNEVIRYEIWRKVDEKDTFALFGNAEGNQMYWSGISGVDGFQHKFRIRGFNAAGLQTYSNSSMVEFKHPLYIPNVFTPNDDLTNDNFLVKNIELYPENELRIYNRWGKEVYRKNNYLGEWNGDSLQNGIYFYSLFVKKLNKSFKGWLQILY